jgi:MoxR-like ATPase
MEGPKAAGRSVEEANAVEGLGRARGRLLEEIHKAVIGQDEVIEQLLIALFCQGHCLLVGVPGLAKTLLVRMAARVLRLSFNRIQFTPDLMPSDVTGTEILDQEPGGRRAFRFVRGPIFANIILADEINRTPPKTQAALLQAMQEYQVTAGGQTYELERPFFVLATQNPIEQEGTYPLPEAQLDRFMFMVNVGYPSAGEERRIVRATTSGEAGDPQAVLEGAEVLRLQGIVRQMPVSEHVVEYAVRLVRATRPGGGEAAEFIREWLTWGAGPRGAQYLVLGAKARAVLHGRYNVNCDDVRAVALPVLRHRLFTNFHADAEGVKSDDIVRRLVETVGEPSAEEYRRRG